MEERKEVAPPTPKAPIELPKVSIPEIKVSPPKIPVPEMKITPPKVSIPEIKVSPPKVKIPEVKPAPPKATKTVISSEPSDPVSDAFSNIFGVGKSSESKDESAKEAENKKKVAVSAAAAEAKKKQAEVKRAEAIAAAEEKKKAALAAAEARRKESEEKRAAALAAVEAKRKEAQEKRIESQKEKQIESLFSKVKSSGTISLGFFGFGQKSDEDESEKVQDKPVGAPQGVPKLRNWRQNTDGSITGLIYGSRSFGAGESVTTSPIKGKPEVNSVVTTKSGSK